MKLNLLTMTILELNAALDSGKYDAVSIDEVEKHIEAGDIVEFMVSTLGTDLSLLDDTARGELTEWLQDILSACGGRERRKWGIENRGVCLLIAWVNEFVQQRKFSD